MPQLGETVAEGKITKWFKQAGDDVKPGENLFEIETDKTSMEVPSTVAGKLTAINFKVGDVAKVGAVIAVIGGDSFPFAPAKAAAQNQEPGPRLRGDEREKPSPPQQIYKPSGPMDPFREVRTPERNYGPANVGGRQVTPLARRLAGERGIDLANVKGSGPHGRIVAKDVEAGGTTHMAPAASVAQLYLVADVEIGRALALCAEANAGTPQGKPGESALTLSLDNFVIKAWAAALQRVVAGPAKRNSRLESSDIAVAIARDDGFVTFVIGNAGAKSLTAIAAEMRDLTARDNSRDPGDLAGVSSVIHNFSAQGVREAGLAVSPPHSLVLVIGAARRAPVEADDGSVKFISVMTVTLSCDHRVVDGALGGQLLAAFKGFVENPVTALI
jgi:pyruvate dehydrogenase E2 component (dihydrolipoamide acetyltransferase)